MKENIYLSVVIPCYDEMSNLQKGVLDKVQHFLDKAKFYYEVIVVDDGSKDGSVEFIEDFIKQNDNFILIKNQHSGKAGAVTAGVLAAKGDYILFTDMDQATPIEEVNKFFPFTKDGYDVVIGSRSNQRQGAPWTRKFVSKATVILRKMLIGLPEIVDTQCGFKMFSHNVAQQLFTKFFQIHDGFKNVSGSNVSAGMDMEVLYLAKKMGYKIKEVPVRWLHVETRRVSPLRSSIAGFIDLLVIKKNIISGIYK